jgi:predicted lipoprotein with Yx(FWY)xxD motif
MSTLSQQDFGETLMFKAFLRATFVIALLLAVAKSAEAAGPAAVGNTANGPALVDAKGITLYTFDKDVTDKSTCNGKCAENWPPLLADPGIAPPPGYTVIARDDGRKQWAYKGKPLYGWAKDKKPGDTTGNGVNNVWHIARP